MLTVKHKVIIRSLRALTNSPGVPGSPLFQYWHCHLEVLFIIDISIVPVDCQCCSTHSDQPMPVRWMRRALLGVFSPQLAQNSRREARLRCFIRHVASNARSLHLSRPRFQGDHIPLRKELKDAARSARLATPASSVQSPDILDDWELTVGIEVHAQLNTSRKLFSRKWCMALSCNSPLILYSCPDNSNSKSQLPACAIRSCCPR